MMNSKDIFNTVCICLLYCPSALETDIDCTVGCACCVDRVCGKGKWFPNECLKGCIDGYRSARCYEKCSYNCKRCLISQDHCTSCNDGYYLSASRACTACLPNCKTCSSSSSCVSCKDGYYNKNGSNDCRYHKCAKNCKCENTQCVSCIDGFYDTSNKCNSLCPVNCITCSSITNCDTCKDGYYNGYQNNDNSLPLLNDCTYKCRENCIRCSSIDLCLKCKFGLYGPICEKKCSAGCMTGICDIQSGNCNCSSNFLGDKCDRCPRGKYGDICDKHCSTGCKGNVCDKDTGNCIYGCIVDTIVGKKCDVCSKSLHGTYCNLSCSAGCKNEQCKRSDSECTFGCLNNFKGHRCDQCINGKYGELCNNHCSENCVDESCLRESGNCIKCLQNFDGKKCDKCVNGFYGSTCSEKCPSKCLNSVCDRDLGTCLFGCVDNFSGDRCCISNENCMYCLTNTKCEQCKSGYFTDQCDEPCHQNCIDSCNIKTGICDDCKSNFYGEHCQISCASTCSYQSNTSEKRCHRTDGTCRHGCVDGFHGVWCSKNCSINCIDYICNQGDGKCIKGCQPNVLNNPICSLDPDPISLEQQLYTATVVLGTLLAVSLMGYIILMAILILRRCRQRESTGRPIYENADVELKCGTERTEDSPSDARASSSKDVAKSPDYEDLRGVQVTEHEYGDVRITA